MGEPSSEKFRQLGNSCYRNRDYRGAVQKYSEGLAASQDGTSEMAVLLANRAQALLADCRYEECMADCKTVEMCGVASEELLVKIKHRQTKALEQQGAANCKAAAAEEALQRRCFSVALPAFNEALAQADQSESCIRRRSELLCGRGDVLAACGDFVAALKDAESSLSLRPTARSAAMVKRLSEYLDRRQSKSLVCETGIKHLQTSLTKVRVANIVVTLREILLSTTGGRLWHAALVLAHWFVAPQGGGVKTLEAFNASGARILELGAGLGLVGLAVAAAAPKCAVTLSDCETLTLGNLRAEVVLNGFPLEEYEDSPAASNAVGGRTVPVKVADFDYTSMESYDAGTALEAPYDLVLGSDVIFSESHAVMGDMLVQLLKPDGLAVLCQRNARVGSASFMERCQSVGLQVEVVEFEGDMLEQARTDVDEEDLCCEKAHSLYFVRHKNM